MLKKLRTGRQTGFLRRMLFSVVMARWQEYEKNGGSDRGSSVYFFLSRPCQQSKDPCVCWPLPCILLPWSVVLVPHLAHLHVCSQWVPGVKHPARNGWGGNHFSKSFYLMRLAKVDCAPMQFSGILFAPPRNHWKINSLSHSESAMLCYKFCVSITCRLYS